MKRITKRKLFDTFHIFVAVYAVVLLTASLTNIVYAQSQSIRDYRLENLESRMATFDALKLDARLTRIETILTELQDESRGNWVSSAASGGVALLLARAVFLAVRNRSIGGSE